MNPLLDLYNLLLLNINIYGFQMHIWSLVVYSSFVFFTFLKIKTHTSLIRGIVLSFFIGLTCNNLYETVWFLMTFHKINLYYCIIDVIFIFILYFLNKRFGLFKLKRITIVLASIEVLSFLVLLYTGHYVFLREWLFTDTTFDPHNWIWMINKALGVGYIYPSIRTKHILTTITKRSNKIKKD